MHGDQASYERTGDSVEFFVFGATLIAIAVLHGHVLPVALSGMALTAICKLVAPGSSVGAPWLLAHVGHEWPAFANIFLL